jgi:hypothetical protein
MWCLSMQKMPEEKRRESLLTSMYILVLCPLKDAILISNMPQGRRELRVTFLKYLDLAQRNLKSKKMMDQSWILTIPTTKI